MAEDGKLKIDSMMVMISVSVRCRSKTLYIRRSFRSLWQKPNLQRTDIGAEGTTEGRKQNKNKSKSWKIGEIKYRQNITCWNCNQKGHFQNKCLKLVASKDKEVNMARDSDDALVCYVENTVKDHIMDSSALFHATYCKEELERFKLRSGKVRLADDKTLDIAGVGDVILKTSFGTSWTLKDVRYIPGLKRRLISVGQLDKEGRYLLLYARWFGEAEEAFLHNVSKDKETAEVGAIGVTFAVAERLSRAFKAESTGIRAEALKMLWSDSVSTAYLIYRTPYVPIRLRIPEEEWRGKDTSLAHLKAVAQMKCDTAFGIRRVTRLSEAEILHLWTRFINPGGSLDTSEGSENSGSFEDSGRSDEEDSKDRASSEEGGSETLQLRRSTRESRAPVRYSPSANYLLLTENGEPESYSEALSSKEFVQWKKAINEEMVSLEKNQTWSLVRLPAGKKALQSKWVFRVKEEQDGSKRYGG
ncbi:retrovirus-related pol polyprotein from transposon TNT 1-94 [Tanacetum coccineum]